MNPPGAQNISKFTNYNFWMYKEIADTILKYEHVASDEMEKKRIKDLKCVKCYRGMKNGTHSINI